MNPETYRRYLNTYATTLEKWGLDWRLAYVYAVLDAYLYQQTGKGAPSILSGYRTPEKQRELYNLWIAGDAGVQYRPAPQSLHLIGQAIDVNKAHSNYDLFRDWFNGWLLSWGIDGSSFGDPGHFAINTGEKPDPVY